jgi:hypothetical protein
MKMRKPRRVYICSVTFDHEAGETDCEVHADPKRAKHKGCSVYACDLVFKKVAIQGNPNEPGAFIPIRQMRHAQMKSIRSEIKRLQAFYKLVQKEKL